jgi:hypothetical protein
LQRCKHVNRNSNHLQEHLLLLSLRNQATPNAPRDHQNASSGDLISGERRTALVLEVLAARGRSSFLFSQLQQCENDFRSNPKLRSAILENGEESRRIVRRDNKLGADYGQFPVRGTPFVDPPLRENMTAAPLPGAKALPFASHVDTVKCYWSNDILWSVLAENVTTDGGYTLLRGTLSKRRGSTAASLSSCGRGILRARGRGRIPSGRRSRSSQRRDIGVHPARLHPRLQSSERNARMLNLQAQAGFKRLIEMTSCPATAGNRLEFAHSSRYTSSLRSRMSMRNCQPSKLISMRPNSSHGTSRPSMTSKGTRPSPSASHSIRPHTV